MRGFHIEPKAALQQARGLVRRLSLMLGFAVALVLLGVAGYRMTSYNLPVAQQQYLVAAASNSADKPLMLLDEAMLMIKQQKAAEAKQLLSEAYEACLDEQGEVAKQRVELAAKIKFRQGNLLVYAGDAQGAIDAYCESLRLEPGNLNVKYNLELLLLQSGGNGGGKPIVVPGSSQQRDQGI